MTALTTLALMIAFIIVFAICVSVAEVHSRGDQQ